MHNAWTQKGRKSLSSISSRAWFQGEMQPGPTRTTWHFAPVEQRQWLSPASRLTEIYVYTQPSPAARAVTDWLLCWLFLPGYALPVGNKTGRTCLMKKYICLHKAPLAGFSSSAAVQKSQTQLMMPQRRPALSWVAFLRGKKLLAHHPNTTSWTAYTTVCSNSSESYYNDLHSVNMHAHALPRNNTALVFWGRFHCISFL